MLPRILHIQQHHTPFYTVEAFQHRQEIIKTNGELNTYHVGAYLGDGLHEGAITSAIRVAQLIANTIETNGRRLAPKLSLAQPPLSIRATAVAVGVLPATVQKVKAASSEKDTQHAL